MANGPELHFSRRTENFDFAKRSELRLHFVANLPELRFFAERRELRLSRMAPNFISPNCPEIRFFATPPNSVRWEICVYFADVTINIATVTGEFSALRANISPSGGTGHHPSTRKPQ